MNTTFLLALVVVVGGLQCSRTWHTSGRPPADLWQTSGRPLADLQQTSGRPPADTFTSNIPPPPPPPGTLLRPPRVGFSASAGFSASTGLSTFLAPRVALTFLTGVSGPSFLGSSAFLLPRVVFSGTGASTFTGLSAFLSFLAADFERDLDLYRLSDLPRPLHRLRVLQLYQQPLLLPLRRLFEFLQQNYQQLRSLRRVLSGTAPTFSTTPPVIAPTFSTALCTASSTDDSTTGPSPTSPVSIHGSKALWTIHQRQPLQRPHVQPLLFQRLQQL